MGIGQIAAQTGERIFEIIKRAGNPKGLKKAAEEINEEVLKVFGNGVKKFIEETSRGLDKIIKGAPEEASIFEIIFRGGKNEAGKDILERTIRFKNETESTIQKVVDHTEDGDFFRTVNNYIRKKIDDGKRTIIKTCEFKNRRLLSSKQETIAGDKKVVTRTSVTKNYHGNENASTDTHRIREYRNGELKNNELEFSFERDSKGFVSSPINIKKASEEILSGSHSIDLSDPYLHTYLNPYQKEVIQDIITARATERGFGKMPEICIYNESDNDLGAAKTMRIYFKGHYPELEIKNVKYCDPEIFINTADIYQTLNTIAHEEMHLEQFAHTIDKEALSKMSKKISEFWKSSSIVKEGLPNSNPSLKEKYFNSFVESRENDFVQSKKLLPENECSTTYYTSLIEVEARQAGEEFANFYHNKLRNLRDNFSGSHWNELMAQYF